MDLERWRQVRLGEVLTQVSRPRPVEQDGNYQLLGVRWYGNGCHLHDTIPGAKLKTPVLNSVDVGDVTYNKMWVSKGAFAVVDENHRGLFATNEYPTFKASPDLAFPPFLRWKFRDYEFVSLARSSCRGTTSRARLNPKDFLGLPLALPPLAEQRKIAAILSSVADAIEATQAVIDQLQVVKKAMMGELLTRGLPGRHTRFKQTDLGEVPEGWEMSTVGNLGVFSGGNGFRPGDWKPAGLPIIRIQNLNGSTDFNHYAGEPDPAWLVEPGDLLFAWAGTKGASFGPCMWPGPRGVLNQHIHRIVPTAGVRKLFYFYVLRLLTEAVEKKAHGFKATLVHLRKRELTQWPVAVPSLAEQDEIVAVLGAIEDRAAREDKVLLALVTAKGALMSVLLTGEVRVTPDKAAA